MPDKISKRSRNVGGAKRGRPPKNQPSPTPEVASAPLADTVSSPVQNQSDTNQAPFSLPLFGLTDSAQPTFPNPHIGGSNSTLAKTDLTAQRYTGIQQINHGLNVSTFDANNYLPSDLFSASSSLESRTKAEVDPIVDQIEGQIQFLRIPEANLRLTKEIVKLDNTSRQIEGLLIDRQTTLVNNGTKYINFQSALTDQSIADTKYLQRLEALNQEQSTLSGMRLLTPLIGEYYQAQKDLKETKIRAIQQGANYASQKLDEQLRQMASEFLLTDS